MIKWPWKKRVEDQVKQRQAAERRLKKIVEDGRKIDRHAREVNKELTLNDWTLTAKRVFSGRDK